MTTSPSQPDPSGSARRVESEQDGKQVPRPTRISVLHAGLIAATVVLVLLVVFAIENRQTVNVSFNGFSGEAIVKLDHTISVGVALVPRSMGIAIREPVSVRVLSRVEGKVRP